MDWLIQIGSIIGGSALTAIISIKLFLAYLEAKDKRDEETNRLERTRMLDLLEKQVQANQQVAVLNEKVALVLNKMLLNGHNKEK